MGGESGVNEYGLLCSLKNMNGNDKAEGSPAERGGKIDLIYLLNSTMDSFHLHL